MKGGFVKNVASTPRAISALSTEGHTIYDAALGRGVLGKRASEK